MRFLRLLFGKSLPQEGSASQTTAPASFTESQTPQTQWRTQTKARIVTRLEGFPFEVVGESHYQAELAHIAGGYRRDSQAIVLEATITLEPGNRFDPNAVRVDVEGRTVGYLRAKDAPRIRQLMRHQGVDSAIVRAQLRGGWKTNQHDQGLFGVRLQMPTSGWIDFGVGATEPEGVPLVAPSRPQKREIPDPAPSGVLKGQWIVLWGLPKDGEVAHKIAGAGGKIMAGIGKSTTMVVRDDTPITPGMLSSATWKKLEELRNAGQDIEMIGWRELESRIGQAGR